MNRTRVVVFIIIGITLLIIASAMLISFVNEVGQLQQGKVNTTPAPTDLPHDTVLLTIASSSTKQAWMESVVVNFHAAGKTTRGGKRIVSISAEQ